MKNNTESLLLRESRLDLSVPVVMGILNTTPDSFSDGGEFLSAEKALQRIEEMITQGAAIIDVGGESTRPGSDPVEEVEELNRVIPVLEKAIAEFPDTIFSIDTTKYKVAAEALKAGVHIINDVSGLRSEPRFADLCASFNAGYVLMHSIGNPKTMQVNPEYEDVIAEIGTFFEKKIQILKSAGVQSVIVDPGIGFGKTLQHNLEIIEGLQKFSNFNCPILVGASRKSMIGQLLDGRPADGRLAGTLAVHYHCLMMGTSILRVHDIQEACDTIRIFHVLRKSKEY
jgi:dihydropteroate synthase